MKWLEKILLICTLFLFCCLSYFLWQKIVNKLETSKIISTPKTFSQYMTTTKETNLYEIVNNHIYYVGKVSSNVELEFDINQSNKYNYNFLKLNNLDFYILNKNLEVTDQLDYEAKYRTYKNYVAFNESIITNDSFELNIDENKKYLINKSLSLPIIIKDDDKYYIEYDNKLLYIIKDDIKEIIKAENTNEVTAKSIPVLAYHYIVEENNTECLQEICIKKSAYEAQLKYIKNNGFYTLTMEDLELWIDKKINLPNKSVVITIDDGWYVDLNIELLEKYDLHATLFLITSLASVDAYSSPNLEIHSHSHALHNLYACPGGLGSPFKCYDEGTLLNDLAKSREILNNTTVFCYPFFEYNNYTINILKKAGFTMAFAGGRYKVSQNTNKFAIPRYSILNYDTVKSVASYIN